MAKKKKATTAKKKATTKKATTKSSRKDQDTGESIPDGLLGDWADEVPDPLQQAADEYDSLYQKAANATSKSNAAREKCIDLMKKHNINRVRIRNGKKHLTLSTADRLKIEKPKEPTSHEDVGPDGVGA